MKRVEWLQELPFNKKGFLIRPKLPEVIPIDYITTKINKVIPDNYINSYNYMLSENSDFDPEKELNKFFIVEGHTGSGKSTVFSPELFIRLLGLSTKAKYVGKNIYASTPKTINARKSAIDQTKMYDNLILGENIGYLVGGDKVRPQHGLVYLTLDYMTLLLTSNPLLLESLNAIIVDEVHEQYTSLIILLAFLKDQYYKFKTTKIHNFPVVVLVSATLNEAQYQNYFNIPDSNIFEIGGESKSITECWATDETTKLVNTVQEYVITVIKTIEADLDKLIDLDTYTEITTIGKTNGVRNIIVFVQGESHSKRIKLLINSAKLKYYKTIVSVNSHEYAKNKDVIADNGLPTIYISTNIAETGLTMPHLKFVIDTGYKNQAYKFSGCNFKGLFITPISQSESIQRKGRVGRNSPGIWYSCYTEQTFNKFNTYATPYIVGEGVKDVFTKLMFNDDFNLLDLDIMEYPTINGLLDSIILGQYHGFLKPAYKLTDSSTTESNFTKTDIGKLFENTSRTYACWYMAAILCNFSIDEMKLIYYLTIVGNITSDLDNYKVKAIESVPKWLKFSNDGTPIKKDDIIELFDDNIIIDLFRLYRFLNNINEETCINVCEHCNRIIQETKLDIKLIKPQESPHTILFSNKTNFINNLVAYKKMLYLANKTNLVINGYSPATGSMILTETTKKAESKYVVYPSFDIKSTSKDVKVMIYGKYWSGLDGFTDISVDQLAYEHA